ncbi:MAG: hypothetical protein HND47_08605 [Chloroflexi bacterium]|nr:hypothetical protein [Chloroflexota bacterium]
MFCISGVHHCQSRGSGISPIIAARAVKYPLTITLNAAETLNASMGVCQEARPSSAINPSVRFGWSRTSRMRPN